MVLGFAVGLLVQGDAADADCRAPDMLLTSHRHAPDRSNGGQARAAQRSDSEEFILSKLIGEETLAPVVYLPSESVVVVGG